MSAPIAHPERTRLEPWVLRRAGARDEAGLRRHQLRALRATVRRAKESSRFYARRLHDVDPDGLADLAGVAGLPFTTADDVRSSGMDMLCVRQGEVERIVTLPTSGTTGDPKRIFFTATDQELTIDFFEHGMSVLVEPGDRVLILLPGERPGSVGDLLRRGLARMQVEGVVHGPVRDVCRALAVLQAGRFDAVVGIPVQVLGLARRSVAEGPAVRLKSVLLSTDHAPRSLVAAIEDAWGCRVFDHYGTTEMGLGGGVECEAHMGYHLREADLLFEVVDIESGAPVPDGHYGEVVFTTLTREAMPLIRYRTGDYSRFVPRPCPCGSWLRVLDTVRTRVAGRVRLKNGEMLDLAAIDEALFALPDVADCHVRLSEDRGTLSVEVLAASCRDRGVAQRDGLDALSRRAVAALEAVSAIGSAVRVGHLDLRATAGTAAWPGSDGTAKRMLKTSEHTEEPG